MSTPFNTNPGLRCAFTNVRKTDRLLAHFYDRSLAPSGLTAIQFGLLAYLAAMQPVSINRMAEVMGMDRTTVTRNINLAGEKKLIHMVTGEDRRLRLITMTPEGEQALKEAWPLWQQAQNTVEQEFGAERFEHLLQELAAIRSIIQ
ncbi:MarR family winged helix-turn-helix transcriptional regulator [Gorillibacterium sp. sgz5001074]|uniref:MarR family winged helix-turn-helix transcriptional regulator n=1 Tax=Gorillibacterium sp. sgz5001074 TaxID=3446695 RepID=UPI003F67231D